MAIKGYLSGAQRHGWGAYAASRLFSRLQSLGLHLWVVHARPLEADFVIPPEHAQRYEFRRIMFDEALAQSQANPQLGLSRNFLERAFERGDICVGAFEDGRLVAYTWRSLDLAPVEEGLWLQLVQPGCRYGYKALVLDDYRGQRLNETVRYFYDREMVAMGIRQNVAYIDLHNLPSLRAHRGLRRQRVGYAGYFRAGRVWLTFRSPRVRQYFRFVRTPEAP